LREQRLIQVDCRLLTLELETERCRDYAFAGGVNHVERLVRGIFEIAQDPTAGCTAPAIREHYLRNACVDCDRTFRRRLSRRNRGLLDWFGRRNRGGRFGWRLRLRLRGSTVRLLRHRRLNR